MDVCQLTSVTLQTPLSEQRLANALLDPTYGLSKGFVSVRGRRAAHAAVLVRQGGGRPGALAPGHGRGADAGHDRREVPPLCSCMMA